MTKIVLFLIYGDRPVYQLELAYSVLSVARFLRRGDARIRIVLASDARNRRPDLPADPLIIPDDTLREWQMGGHYAHAAKAHVLRHAMSRFGAPTVLMDTDTILHAHPQTLFSRIGPGRPLMHQREGPLRDSDAWPAWADLIARTNGSVEGQAISGSSVMFNSGILGVHPDDAPLLDRFVRVVHAIRHHSDMFTAEQLAASLVLAGQGRTLSTCEDVVEHYWDGPRAYYHYQLRKIAAQDRGCWRRLAADGTLPPLARTPPIALRHRLASRIKRLRLSAGPEFGFAYQAYLSALSHRTTDPELANVWATASLGMLTWGSEGRVSPKDFSHFFADRLDRQSWMSPALRARWTAYWSSAIACKDSNASA